MHIVFTQAGQQGFFSLSVASGQSLKGTVACDFRPLAFTINRTHSGLCFVNKFLFEFCFKFAELFEFKNCYALYGPLLATSFFQIPGIYNRDGTGLG